jgi:hypothetical protein
VIPPSRQPGADCRSRGARRAAILALWAVAAWTGAATPAFADLYFSPFVALKFGGETTLIDQDLVAGSSEAADTARKFTWGGGVMWLGTGVLGFEGEIALTPGYFKGDSKNVLSSRVTTVLANAVIAAPLTLTRESLRPYASAGWGLMRASSDVGEPALSFTRNLSAFNVGGGAIGMLSRRTGVRWDVRYLRGIGNAEGGGTLLGGSARLSYWRASMAVVIRTR